ncbi:hypothetical protein R3I93_005985 [Phoxinus phoxinus]|uniref:Uncharacterized protein n=1 Tax=Phoxinus phoxinus TaxID=58324 RepID=A0AAN9H915_9TELE
MITSTLQFKLLKRVSCGEKLRETRGRLH